MIHTLRSPPSLGSSGWFAGSLIVVDHLRTRAPSRSRSRHKQREIFVERQVVADESCFLNHPLLSLLLFVHPSGGRFTVSISCRAWLVDATSAGTKRLWRTSESILTLTFDFARLSHIPGFFRIERVLITRRSCSTGSNRAIHPILFSGLFTCLPFPDSILDFTCVIPAHDLDDLVRPSSSSSSSALLIARTFVDTTREVDTLLHLHQLLY